MNMAQGIVSNIFHRSQLVDINKWLNAAFNSLCWKLKFNLKAYINMSMITTGILIIEIIQFYFGTDAIHLTFNCNNCLFTMVV